jgi:predicted nucleotidyltransferase
MPAKPTAAMITETGIHELCKRIVDRFEPEKIILFGSYATGHPHSGSDIDLLVILPFEGRGFQKSLEILNTVSPQFPVDLIARTPEDTTRRYEEGDPLIREALDRGKLLYERDGKGVARQG